MFDLVIVLLPGGLWFPMVSQYVMHTHVHLSISRGHIRPCIHRCVSLRVGQPEEMQVLSSAVSISLDSGGGRGCYINTLSSKGTQRTKLGTPKGLGDTMKGLARSMTASDCDDRAAVAHAGVPKPKPGSRDVCGRLRGTGPSVPWYCRWVVAWVTDGASDG